MKIIYTKGRIALLTVTLFIAALCLNFSAGAKVYSTCVSPTLSATPTDITCHGAHNGTVALSVTGTATPPYTYSWTSSNGFTSTSQNISGLDSGSYTVLVTATGGCTNTTTVVVSQPMPLTLATLSNAPFCPGNTLTLYCDVTGGTAAYNFAWTGPMSFTSTAQNPNINAATAANDGIYNLVVTDINGCTSSSTFSVLLYPSPIIGLDTVAYICAGHPITLDAGNPGSTFSWNTGVTTQAITADTAGHYYVTATNGYMCSTSDSIHVIASPYLAPSISITANDSSVCAGTLVTFNATAVNGGTTPTYLWRKNGIIVGSTSSTYTSSTLNNGDYITARLTSSFACALPTTAYSDTIRMQITANVPAGVLVTHLPDTACSGTPITFTATAINGGTAPYYQWIKGGAIVGTGNTFIYSPTAADTIGVQMVSSIVCHTPDTATSSSSFVIYPTLVPTALITYTPNDTVAFLGAIVTFFCEATYVGATPTYQWYVNKVAVPGATNSSYARHVYENDTVRCVVNSSIVCAIPRRDTSNAVIIYASFLDVNGINVGGTNVNVFPNPTSGDFTLTGSVATKNNNEVLIEVRDLKGSVVYRKNIMIQNGKVNEQLSLKGQLADGMYLLRIQSDIEEKQLKIVIKK